MARGAPMRPAGGGGGRPPQPPRRPPPRTPPKQQPKQQPKQPKQQPRKTDQQRRTQQQQRQTDQQRRAAAAKAAAQRRTRANQQYYLEQHGARRHEEVEQLTAELHEQVAELESILATGLRRSSHLDLDALYRPAEGPPFDPGPLGRPAPEPTWESFAPGWFSGLLAGRARSEEREAAAREAYEQALEEWEREERERVRRLAEAEERHETLLAARREEAERYHDRIARVAAGLRRRDPKVVESFLRTVLRRVPLPADFPRRADVTHHPDEERVEVRMVMPGRDVVPETERYEYEEAPDEVRAVPRPADAADELYQLVVAQVALLVVRDVFDAELHLARVAFEGLVDGADPVCLIRLEAARDAFAGLDLERVPPRECLRRLDAALAAADHG